MGFQFGDEIVEAETGAAAVGHAGVPHTFWNLLLVMSLDTISLINGLHAEDRIDSLADHFRRHGCELLV